MVEAIEFVETSVFTSQIKQLASDEDLLKLQVDLIAQPRKGRLIEGTGGLRKVRMSVGKRGKSAGVRVVYLIAHRGRIYFLYAYPKSKKDNLTNVEKSELKQLSAHLKGGM